METKGCHCRNGRSDSDDFTPFAHVLSHSGMVMRARFGSQGSIALNGHSRYSGTWLYLFKNLFRLTIRKISNPPVTGRFPWQKAVMLKVFPVMESSWCTHLKARFLKVLQADFIDLPILILVVVIIIQVVVIIILVLIYIHNIFIILLVWRNRNDYKSMKMPLAKWAFSFVRVSRFSINHTMPVIA